MMQSDTTALSTLSEQIASAIQRRDRGWMAACLAPGFVQRTPGGPSSDAETFLDALSRIPGEILSVAVHDLQVDVAHDSAIVCGVQDARVQVDGTIVDDRRAFVDFFVKLDGEWRLRAAVDLPRAGA